MTTDGNKPEPHAGEIEAAAKAAYWCMNTIMHDHDQVWRDCKQQEVWRDVARAALQSAARVATPDARAAALEEARKALQEVHQMLSMVKGIPTECIERDRTRRAAVCNEPWCLEYDDCMVKRTEKRQAAIRALSPLPAAVTAVKADIACLDNNAD